MVVLPHLDDFALSIFNAIGFDSLMVTRTLL